MTKNTFKIDFFELSFLTEACIPNEDNMDSTDTSIVFWDKMCNNNYYSLGDSQKTRLLEWISKNPNFDLNNKYCEDFYGACCFNQKSDNKDVYNERIFEINFEEFKILVSASIPPRPIARSMFWNDVCNSYYHQMTSDERKELFDFICNNQYFKLRNEDSAIFYARFNPDRQYLVHTKMGDTKEVHETYRFNGRYYTAKNTSINEDYIVKIGKII